MASKVNFRVIKDNLDQIEENIKIKIASPKSSDAFDDSRTTIIESFASYWIFVSIMFYCIKTNERLDETKINHINEHKSNLLKLYSNNDVKQNEFNWAIQFLKKIPDLQITRHMFEERKIVQFDDRHKDHKRAFKKNHPNEYPPQNIFLRLIIDGVHIRCGIAMNFNEKVPTATIIDIVDKKNGNK